ncbi:hypothetical protein QAD02_005819 [Eretmocerus hayati]|uniref:Uncharacterized protein n=1 Tax=Eretmocerus hayati TaxID=131215 RepID=A0ACC2NTW5_9HYME|nr:hypothetical protein QAD02_005819 [Eretmocerus hayati]
MQLIADIAGAALAPPDDAGRNNRRALDRPAQEVLDIPARALLNAPERQIDMMEIVEQLPPMVIAQPREQQRPQQPTQEEEPPTAAQGMPVNEGPHVASPSGANELAPSNAAAEPQRAAAPGVEVLSPLDLSARSAAIGNPADVMYELRPAPQVQEGERPALRFVFRRVPGGQNQQAVPAPAAAEIVERLQPAEEDRVPDDAVWRDIADFVRGDAAESNAK